MRAIGMVAWWDGGTGRDVAVLEPGAPRAVGLPTAAGVSGSRAVDTPHEPVFRESVARDGARASATAWRARWPDLADAARAGTWGDGGRDY